MDKLTNYKDLRVWQEAMELAVEVYALTSCFPTNEQYGLISQLRRASVSVAANISEGHSRISSGEFKQFLGIARGSLAEVETLVMIAVKAGIVANTKTEPVTSRIQVISKMLNGLIKAIQKQ